MIVVFAILGTGLGIKEVVASDQFEDLGGGSALEEIRWDSGGDTIAAILQTSVLAPHLDPKMTSGDLYCLV